VQYYEVLLDELIDIKRCI